LLREGDRLDLVELNATFAALLEERFRSDPVYRNVAGQSRVHVCGIESFQPEGQYDFIVSGLPLNNFSPEFVSQTLETLYGLLAPRGVFSYFEYMFVRPMRKLVAKAGERDRLRGLEAVIDPFLGRHRVRRDWVFLNLPPAWVQHVRKA
jgi:phosphatidylethanolamine/phosphatidyl-N-methylethanolamine N-methyltransferase